MFEMHYGKICNVKVLIRFFSSLSFDKYDYIIVFLCKQEQTRLPSSEGNTTHNRRKELMGLWFS